MASCALTSDFLLGCDVGAGGAIEAWIIEFGNISSFTESSGTITAITKVGGKIFRRYQQVQEVLNSQEDIVGNIQNGTLYYDQKVTIVLNKQAVATRNEILLLAKNALVIIVRDKNETYRLYGRTQGMLLLTGSAATGTALGDRNGYTLNFQGKEAELAPFVSAAAILTLQT